MAKAATKVYGAMEKLGALARTSTQQDKKLVFLVLPSEMEQQPLVLIEAMGAGKPVLATDVGGVKDMLGPGDVLVPPGDVAALRQGLETLVGQEAVAAVGEAAALRARERFSVAHARDRHLELYSTLLDRSSRS